MNAAPDSTATETADAFAERLFGSVLGWIDLISVYMGDKLGWYRSLADDGPATADELAADRDAALPALSGRAPGPVPTRSGPCPNVNAFPPP